MRPHKRIRLGGQSCAITDCPVLLSILQFVTPQPGIVLVCRQFRQEGWRCLGEWVEGQVRCPSTWLETSFVQWWSLKQMVNRNTCGIAGFTVQGHLASWRQVVLERVCRPLREGQTGSQLAAKSCRHRCGELQRSGVVGVDYAASDLEEDYQQMLRSMPWMLLWRKVWQLYRVFPLLHSCFTTTPDHVDVRVNSISFSHTIGSYPVLHLWDRALFTAMPMLQHYLPNYPLRIHNMHRPHRPTPRPIMKRLHHMAELIRRYPTQEPSRSLLRLMAHMIRKPKNSLKFYSTGTADRVLEHSIQVIRRYDKEVWMYCRRGLAGVLAVSNRKVTLFPVQPEALLFFERLGDHWDEVMAEYGQKTGLCGWCSRKTAFSSGEGPRCFQ